MTHRRLASTGAPGRPQPLLGVATGAGAGVPLGKWTKNIEISKPPQAVWDVATDYPNLPKWTAKVSKVEVVPPGPASVGTQVTVTRGRITFTQTVKEMQMPERLYTTIVNGPVTGSSTFTLKPTATGTAVEHTLELDLKGMMKIAGLFIGGGVKKELKMLKRQVEGPTQ